MQGSSLGKTDSCQRYLGLDICKTVLPREITFRLVMAKKNIILFKEIICDKYCNHEYRYGRRDCVTSNPIGYKADKPEVQPDPNGDGKSTQAFFKTNFNFNPQQTVAIMGAHTLGRLGRKDLFLDILETGPFEYVWPDIHFQ